MNKIIISIIIIFTSMVIYFSYNSKISSLEYSISDFKEKTYQLNYELEALKAQNKNLRDKTREYLAIINDYEASENETSESTKSGLDYLKKNNYSFNAWSNYLFNKTPAEVLDLLGKPNSVWRSKRSITFDSVYPTSMANTDYNLEELTYSNLVIDPLTDRAQDLKIQFIPRFNVVYKVSDNSGHKDVHPIREHVDNYYEAIFGDRYITLEE
jgi:hypothetical protein